MLLRKIIKKSFEKFERNGQIELFNISEYDLYIRRCEEVDQYFIADAYHLKTYQIDKEVCFDLIVYFQAGASEDDMKKIIEVVIASCESECE